MQQFDIIGACKRYAENESWHFLSGSNWYQNYEASQQEYDNGQLVLSVDFNASPVYSKGLSLFQVNYEGVIAIGRKFEQTTGSNLDETYIQKYELRLLELMQELSDFIKAFCCENELTPQSVRIIMDLNKFDTNIDFASAQVTLIQ